MKAVDFKLSALDHLCFFISTNQRRKMQINKQNKSKSDHRDNH